MRTPAHCKHSSQTAAAVDYKQRSMVETIIICFDFLKCPLKNSLEEGPNFKIRSHKMA